MALKTTVKVGRITNLSDARYCAGMGVDMLGFVTVEGSQNYINPANYQELRGWFAGPKTVAEIYGIQSNGQLSQIIERYQPDLIELSLVEFKSLKPQDKPVILAIERNEVSELQAMLPSLPENVQYILLPMTDNVEQLSQVTQHKSVLIRMSDESVDSILTLPVGISLEGSSEERPGYKNYDHLASILEQLEDD